MVGSLLLSLSSTLRLPPHARFGVDLYFLGGFDVQISFDRFLCLILLGDEGFEASSSVWQLGWEPVGEGFGAAVESG